MVNINGGLRVMKKVFCHKYKWSHDKKRKKYRRLLKEKKVLLLEKTRDGFLYGVIEG